MRAVQEPPDPALKDKVLPLIRSLRACKVNLHLKLWWGDETRICFDDVDNEPFTLIVNNEALLETRLTQLSLARAYLERDVDFELPDKDRLAVFDLRDKLPRGLQLRQATRFAFELVAISPVMANARAIGRHYNLPDDFFLKFLDDRYRFYSQCHFGYQTAHDVPPSDEELDSAAAAKAAAMANALRLFEPRNDGQERQLLDVGVGWGGLRKFLREFFPDIRVTSLTLTEESKTYVDDREDDWNPPPRGEVIVEDFLDHRARGRYDAIVIFGVIEHIPNYRRFAELAFEALKPGGRLYLDASATREKYSASAFTRTYTWSGAHSCLALPDMLQELIFHGFTIELAVDETIDYANTMSAWAARLEGNHDDIQQRWGESIYRAFRVFLLGGAHALRTDRLQAYTVVARRPADKDRKGPRPGRLRRAAHFAASQISG